MINKRCLGCMRVLSDSTQPCPYCGYDDSVPTKKTYYLQPGTLLKNRYLIGRSIGSGGFGITYIGWDNMLEMRVAIKEYLPGEYATRVPGNTSLSIFGGEKQNEFEIGLSKFMDEAQRLAGVGDVPGIVKIYDCFSENLTAYIVMEFLDGVTLKEHLEQCGGKIPYNDAIQIILPVLGALREVHKEGIIHRDISPDNIFITKGGDIKLLDFGAARYASTGYSKSLSVILKPGYAPEEQYRSHGNQGPWSDVYATAATLYKAITGIIPEESLERKAQDTLQPPSKLGIELPKNAETAILNALNVNAENRTQSAEIFEDQLLSTTSVSRVYEKQKKDLETKIPFKIRALVCVAVLLTSACVFAAVSGMFTLGFGDFIGGSLFSRNDRMVNVPGLINLKSEDGSIKAKEAELSMVVEGSVTSNTTAQGIIMTQTPAPGAAAPEGSNIFVKVSNGPKFGVVPDIVDRVWKNCSNEISDAGFNAKVFEEYSDLVPKGVVISQGREPQSLFVIGEKIKVVVSLGRPDTSALNTSAYIKMPDTNGDYNTIKQMLNEHNISVVKNVTYRGDIPVGSVVASSAVKDEKLHAGDTVVLTVNMGEKKKAMPNIIYATLNDAEAMLKKAGINYEIVYKSSENEIAGIVIAQDIASGELVDSKKTVTVTVSSGPKGTSEIKKISNSKWSVSVPKTSGNKIIQKNKVTIYDEPVYRKDFSKIKSLIKKHGGNQYVEHSYFSVGNKLVQLESDGKKTVDIVVFGGEVFNGIKCGNSFDDVVRSLGLYEIQKGLENQIPAKKYTWSFDFNSSSGTVVTADSSDKKEYIELFWNDMFVVFSFDNGTLFQVQITYEDEKLAPPKSSSAPIAPPRPAAPTSSSVKPRPVSGTVYPIQRIHDVDSDVFRDIEYGAGGLPSRENWTDYNDNFIGYLFYIYEGDKRVKGQCYSATNELLWVEVYVHDSEGSITGVIYQNSRGGSISNPYENLDSYFIISRG